MESQPRDELFSRAYQQPFPNVTLTAEEQSKMLSNLRKIPFYPSDTVDIPNIGGEGEDPRLKSYAYRKVFLRKNMTHLPNLEFSPPKLVIELTTLVYILDPHLSSRLHIKSHAQRLKRHYHEYQVYPLDTINGILFIRPKVDKLLRGLQRIVRLHLCHCFIETALVAEILKHIDKTNRIFEHRCIQLTSRQPASLNDHFHTLRNTLLLEHRLEKWDEESQACIIPSMRITKMNVESEAQSKKDLQRDRTYCYKLGVAGFHDSDEFCVERSGEQVDPLLKTIQILTNELYLCSYKKSACEEWRRMRTSKLRGRKYFIDLRKPDPNNERSNSIQAIIETLGGIISYERNEAIPVVDSEALDHAKPIKYFIQKYFQLS